MLVLTLSHRRTTLSPYKAIKPPWLIFNFKYYIKYESIVVVPSESDGLRRTNERSDSFKLLLSDPGEL